MLFLLQESCRVCVGFGFGKKIKRIIWRCFLSKFFFSVSLVISTFPKKEMVKQQYYRTQGSKHQAVKSRVKKNRVKYFQNFLLFSFSSWRKARREFPYALSGKIFTDPIAATFLMSIWPTRNSQLLSPAVALCPGFGTKPSGVSLNFHSSKTFPQLPLTQPCGSASGLHRGEARMWAACFQCVRADQSCPGWAARLWDGAGEAASPSPALNSTLQQQNTGSTAGSTGHWQHCSSCLTKWFLPPTAT